MSSRKLSDKEFDRYARNILKKPEGVAFDNSAWAAMEQQLAQQTTTSSFFSLKWLIPLVIVVLSGVTYITYQFIDQSDSPQQLTSQEVLQEEAITPGSNDLEQPVVYGETTNTGGSDPDISTKVSTPDDANNENTSTESNQSSFYTKNSEGSTNGSLANETSTVDNKAEQPSTVDKEITQATTVSPESQSVLVTNSDNSNESSQLKKELEEKQSTQAYEIAEKQNAGELSSEGEDNSTPKVIIIDDTETSDPSNKIEPTAAAKNEEENSNSFIKSKGVSAVYAEIDQENLIPLQKEESNTDDLKASQIAKDDPSESTSKRWSVGLVLAPDFSTVESFEEFTKPGLDFGVTVQYFIGKRLSITTGAILTRKLYNTSDLESYTIPQGFWNGGDAPELITADCKVIDIPINLRYQLIEGKKISIFASAGMSSYLMLNEQYGYDYPPGLYTGSQPRGWEVSNENNHFFGVYNVSIGVSKKINDRISLEAEPFIKNSLGGVGWGQVRLNSTGVLMHLKLHF